MKAPVNEFSWPDGMRLVAGHQPSHSPVAGVEGAVHVHGLFTPGEVARLLAHLDVEPWIPVGHDGIREHHASDDPIGSWRASAFSEDLSEVVFDRLAGIPLRRLGADDGRWAPGAVNALWRGIRYEPGGLLVVHRDGPYVASARERSWTSLVMFLEGGDGGATRFVADPEDGVPYEQRTRADWTRPATDDEVVALVRPAPGDALLFDHHLLHDSEPLRDGRKTIFRSDVMWERLDGERLDGERLDGERLDGERLDGERGDG